MSSTSEQKEVYRTFMGCDVLWPPDCPDDILEAVIKEVKSQESEPNKLAFDKDGLKVKLTLRRSPPTSRSFLMSNSSRTGMFSSATISDVMPSTRKGVFCISTTRR